MREKSIYTPRYPFSDFVDCFGGGRYEVATHTLIISMMLYKTKGLLIRKCKGVPCDVGVIHMSSRSPTTHGFQPVKHHTFTTLVPTLPQPQPHRFRSRSLSARSHRILLPQAANTDSAAASCSSPSTTPRSPVVPPPPPPCLSSSEPSLSSHPSSS